MFGRIVGLPGNLIQEIVTVVYVAKPLGFAGKKQVYVETLKVPPYYNPLWIDPAHQDDPDTILDAYPVAMYVNPLTLHVSSSNLLTGEDGTVTFQESDCFEDSVDIQLGQVPLTTVIIDATTNWTQSASGTMTLFDGQLVGPLYTDSLLTGWPKPGAGIGGGWSVKNAAAVDYWGSSQAHTVTVSWQFKDTSKFHAEGSVISSRVSTTHPVVSSPVLGPYVTSTEQVFARLYPNNPDLVDQPNASSKTTKVWIVEYWLKLFLELEFNVNRKRSEHLRTRLTAQMQPLMVDLPSPSGPQDSSLPQDFEILTFTSQDASAPLTGTGPTAVIQDWTAYQAAAVEYGTLIRAPDLSYQICIHPGTTSTTIPTFSNVIGVETDETTGVKWACIGPTPYPYYQNAAWQGNTAYKLGRVVYALKETATSQTGVTSVVTTKQLCIQAGVSGPNVVNGKPFVPAFSSTFGDFTTDGGVIWVSLGVVANTANTGAALSNIASNTFFNTSAGVTAFEYLTLVASKHLIARSRAVLVKTEVFFEQFLGLTLRMSATIHNRHIPGGVATGKIVELKATADGDTGKLTCEVTIACCIGYGNAVVTSPGTPTYVNGYVSGYRTTVGAAVPNVAGNTTYSVPTVTLSADDTTFPVATTTGGIEPSSVVVHSSLNLDGEQTLFNTLEDIFIKARASAPGADPNLDDTLTRLEEMQAQQEAAAVAAHSAYGQYYLELKAVDGGPVNNEATVVMGPLVLPKGIDLEAPSNG
jgi:hypothetical protein